MKNCSAFNNEVWPELADGRLGDWWCQNFGEKLDNYLTIAG